MNIIVTGGLGYIGYLVTEQLLDEGHDVFVMDKNVFNQDTEDIPKVYGGDLREPTTLQVLRDRLDSTDVVIHLASTVGESACLMDPVKTFENNYVVTKKIVDMCAEKNTKLVYASTCSLYGNQDGLLTEESKTMPVDFYGQTKLLGEREVLKHDRNVSLRLGTVYGLGERQRFDLVINKFCGLIGNNEPMQVYGGQQNRPFTHVRDIARAFAFAATNNLSGVYNIAHMNFNLYEAAKQMAEELDGEVELVESLEDNRNYSVVNEKICSEGFEFKEEFIPACNEIVRYVEICKDNPMDDDNYYNNRIIL